VRNTVQRRLWVNKEYSMNLIIGLALAYLAVVLVIVVATRVCTTRRRWAAPHTQRYEPIQRDATYTPRIAHELFVLYPYLEHSRNRARMQDYAQRIATGEALHPSEVSDLKRLVQIARGNQQAYPRSDGFIHH
jgi:hypothetical protein